LSEGVSYEGAEANCERVQQWESDAPAHQHTSTASLR
jgi:hypothetical protein